MPGGGVRLPPEPVQGCRPVRKPPRETPPGERLLLGPVMRSWPGAAFEEMGGGLAVTVRGGRDLGSSSPKMDRSLGRPAGVSDGVGCSGKQFPVGQDVEISKLTGGRSLWRGDGRHFSHQDLSSDDAYIIASSLKGNLKNLPETKGEIITPHKDK